MYSINQIDLFGIRLIRKSKVDIINRNSFFCPEFLHIC